MYNGKSILKRRIIFLVKHLKLIYWPSRLVLPQPKAIVRGRVHHFLCRSLHCARVWLHRVCHFFFLCHLSNFKPKTHDQSRSHFRCPCRFHFDFDSHSHSHSHSRCRSHFHFHSHFSILILLLARWHCEVRVYQNKEEEVGTLCDGACFVGIASICRSFDPVSRIGRARFLCPLVKLSIKVASLTRSMKKGHNRTRRTRRRKKKKKDLHFSHPARRTGSCATLGASLRRFAFLIRGKCECKSNAEGNPTLFIAYKQKSSWC